MALCDFRVSHRTRTAYAKSATLHAQYLTREGRYAPGASAAEAHYVTRTERYAMGKEDLVAKGGRVPEWAQGNHDVFWAAADTYERSGGRLCESWICSLPRELSQAQNVALAQEIARATMGERYAHTWAMHEVRASDGGQQPHLHLMFSARIMDDIAREPAQFFRRYNPDHPELGGAQKDPALNVRSYIPSQRQLYSDLANVHLEAAGSDARMDPHSLPARGFSGRKTELHLGPESKALPRDEQEPRREIVAAENAARREARQASKPEEAEQARRYWEQRKQALGITPDMDHEERIHRIQAANREYVRTQELERRILTQGLSNVSEGDAQAYMQRKEAEFAALRAARQQEQHHVDHPEHLRSPSHLAAIATVLHEDAQDHGRVRRRGRQRDDEQERTPTHARQW